MAHIPHARAPNHTLRLGPGWERSPRLVFLVMGMLPVLLAPFSPRTVFSSGDPHHECVITGSVLDRETRRPLENANVFLSGTTRGTSSDTDGRYTIADIPEGSYKLVASRVGYVVTTVNCRIRSGETTTIDFRLAPVVLQRDEVLVTAPDPNEWRENLGRFKEQFLGTSELATRCTLLNPEVLEFTIDAEDGSLCANTDSTLRIENAALGYRQALILQEFRWDPKNQTLTYKQHSRFEELTTVETDVRGAWIANRQACYEGSKRHFLRSLATNRLESEGFVMYIGEEDEVMRAFGTYVDPESTPILEQLRGGLVKFSFRGTMRVEYRGAGTVDISFIRIMHPPVFVDRNGSLLAPGFITVLTPSAWAEQRISHQLPLDYRPPPR